MKEWEIFYTDEVGDFLDDLGKRDPDSYVAVNKAILQLELNGPAEGRPLVDTLKGSKIANLKELRPPSGGRSEIRIVFAFDPWRSAILLLAGDKAGNWSRWYRDVIPRAEQRFEVYLKQRHEELDI